MFFLGICPSSTSGPTRAIRNRETLRAARSSSSFLAPWEIYIYIYIFLLFLSPFSPMGEQLLRRRRYLLLRISPTRAGNIHTSVVIRIVLKAVHYYSEKRKKKIERERERDVYDRLSVPDNVKIACTLIYVNTDMCTLAFVPSFPFFFLAFSTARLIATRTLSYNVISYFIIKIV